MRRIKSIEGGSKMTPSSRKMRRTREVASSNDGMLSGFGLYDLQGDAKAAMDVFSAPEREDRDEEDRNGTPSLATQYNTMLLSHVVNKTTVRDKDKILQSLEEMEKKILGKKEDHLVSARKRRRNDMILAYNRALLCLAAGQIHSCATMCAEKVKDMIAAKQKPSEESLVVTSRMTFLLLECLLALSVGRNSGLQYKDFGLPHPDDIVDWIEKLETEKDPQHKFLLTLFKSRLALAELDSSGKRIDSKVRAARKELKLAMEIFQHKLRPSFGADTGSVVSSAASEENLSIGMSSPHQEPSHQPPPPSSAVLQRHNQSALSLKANLEQLKGNTKKSLILCGEALGAAKQEWTYQAVHENNLAVVYETNQKRHLAMHALAKALRANTEETLFFSDGTARPDQGHLVLHNAAVCALQARNYVSAYECMGTLCARSSIFRGRPRCWLRMAEACLGIHSGMKRQNQDTKFRPVEVEGELYGVVLEDAMLSDEMEVVREKLVESIGSREDIGQVRRNPLLRARACLEHAIQFEDSLGVDGVVATRLTMSYVYLAFREHNAALEMAKLVIETNEPSGDTDEVSQHLYKRQMAAARMYAAEASCALGEMVDAMKFLVGDGKDDAFDRLASDLGGVTLETAALNGKGKRRLAKAQTMVRTSASAVTAVTGNSQAAKQLANSANAMEDAYAANRERSSARRAMIYTLLREGQQSNALNLLLSLR